jgi:hypothetical protein
MPQYYEIRIKGHLDPSWSEWFEGLSIIHEDSGDTALAGDLVDQAALHGVLRKIRDLGIALVSVNPVTSTPDDRQPS